jgi:hypothetical protein
MVGNNPHAVVPQFSNTGDFVCLRLEFPVCEAHSRHQLMRGRTMAL